MAEILSRLTSWTSLPLKMAAWRRAIPINDRSKVIGGFFPSRSSVIESLRVCVDFLSPGSPKRAVVVVVVRVPARLAPRDHAIPRQPLVRPQPVLVHEHRIRALPD
eukprot:30811-Pelagococcus_subviridis.AAC.6